MDRTSRVFGVIRPDPAQNDRGDLYFPSLRLVLSEEVPKNISGSIGEHPNILYENRFPL